MKELEHLKLKVRIISFLEYVFTVDKDDRSLSFERISRHCQIEMIDVELLVMKSMSLGLVKGLVDEVDQVVHIDWILPGYLSMNHLKIMGTKLQDWEGKVEGAIKLMENGTLEYLNHWVIIRLTLEIIKCYQSFAWAHSYRKSGEMNIKLGYVKFIPPSTTTLVPVT